MTLQLRQIALVARVLAPVIEDFEAILGLHRCYVDPGVDVFGLENTLLPVGRNFLEVVAPVREGTAGGRYLDRRGGDGGYMVIVHATPRAEQQGIRARALAGGVRVAQEGDRPGWNVCQLHPADMIATFLEIDWDVHEDLQGHWMAAGGTGWEDKVDQTTTVDFTGVELQGPDPVALAERWAMVLDRPVRRDGAELSLALDNAVIRFVAATDGRGAGLSGVDLAVRDAAGILERGRRRSRPVTADTVDIGGVRFRLREAA
jgi:hypothetical protein